jgi:hypothetical protein
MEQNPPQPTTAPEGEEKLSKKYETKMARLMIMIVPEEMLSIIG